ncbi:MAG: SPOR domain-containing protein [Planctomycetota bacterium]
MLDSDPLPLVTGTGSAGPGPQRAPIGAGERVANLGADATRSATPGARYSVPSAVRPRATSAPQLLRRGDDPASDGEGASETETRAQSDDEAIETAAVVPSETTTSSPSPTVTAPVAEQIEPPTALRGSAYVQAGIFTAKSYGYRLIENLAAVGLEASPVPTTFRGNDAIRVRLGPFQTAQERQAAIAELRKLGVSDAIPVAQ